MARLLAVPLRLDALRLLSPQSVVEARADFTRMPYWDGQREVNPDVANISEALVSYPFQDRALTLPAGVHLHWALPDALTRGTRKTPKDYPHEMLFPAVPDRWLVIRSGGGGAPRQWIVESDYLHPDKDVLPESGGTSLRSIAIPFPADRKLGQRPFRYLGRVLERGEPPSGPAPEHLTTKGYRLTTVGYQAEPGMTQVPAGGGWGDPTFAALYPNCLSVFGFHDAEPPAEMTGVKYEVIGWFSVLSHDCLGTEAYVKALAAARKNLEAQDKPPSDADLLAATLTEAFGWKLEGAPPHFPERTIFHASIKMDESTEAALPPSGRVTVAIGNTVTEALSAQLARLKVKDGKPNAQEGRPLAEALGKKPEELEAQLEALHLADRIDHLTFDIEPKFQHARHDRAFSAVPGETIWTLRVPSKPSADSTSPAQSAPPAHADALPEELASALNQLNLAQRDYDRARDELDSAQKQLFADWYKYMLCAYPPDDARDEYLDIDEVRYFIQKNGLDDIENRRRVYAQAGQALDARRLAVEQKLQALKSPAVLQSRPGLRYYRPHEPVLLIAGDGLHMTDRYGQSTPPRCSVLESDGTTDIILSIDAIRDKLEQGSANPPGAWHPFALDWRVELRPLKAGNNLAPDDRAYAAGFIVDHYKLDDERGDLRLKRQGEIERAASIYSGSSLLTPHARLKLQDRIAAFLSRRFPDWKTAGPSPDPVVETMRQVARIIDQEEFHVLGQALNGFNEALLMHKQTLQLPLGEPLGFDDARTFTKRVHDAVGQNTYVAPQPLDDFHPIRTGGFQVLDLRLVDTFGRVRDLTVDQWVAPETMPASDVPGFLSLPPRLVQPARLLFRWLSASSLAARDEMETNSHPASTPICGWLLPNHLDQSLMVYSAAGQAQGAITQEGRWESAPGGRELQVDELPEHLQELVKHVMALKAKGRLPAFLQDLETALENTHPANTSQHEALALLMGRPIAVVRARLKLELRGLPALNQSWDAFRSDVSAYLRNEDAGRTERLTRKSDGVEKVRFSIRLGDRRQLNDGLLGYWIEYETSGSRYSTYYSSKKPVNPLVESPVIERSVDDGDMTVTMLVDPHGPVHLTSGILPAEALELPPEHYAAALRAIEVTFLTAPVLSPASRVALPLPAEAEHAWSWVSRHGGSWAAPAELGPVSTQAGWDEPLEIHDGWLKLTNRNNG